ncbi:hypothetical protein ACGFYA_35140 [Streptomyces sp. NPDC048305]|uniref:hypothetical protein n=1 Tax=Streptomyces sp. NPDC048305 TaxID=3365532 RepID=UPI00371916C8
MHRQHHSGRSAFLQVKVWYDPDGLIEAQLPLDHEPYECLIKAVLAWTDEGTLAVRDYEQIALQLTGHARAVASYVRRRPDQLPKSSGPQALADIVLRETEGRLSAGIDGTVCCARRERPSQTVRVLTKIRDEPCVKGNGVNCRGATAPPSRERPSIAAHRRSRSSPGMSPSNRTSSPRASLR